MAFIDNEIINKIRNSINIVDIIGEYVPLTAKGRNFFGVCPFHDDHSPSMSVSPDKQIYTCFSCGATGNVFKFIQDYENISFVEAVNKLSIKTGINTGINIKDIKTHVETDDTKILNFAQKFYLNNLKTEKGQSAIKYLKQRSIDENIINKFGIGLALNETNTLTTLLSNKGYNIYKLLNIGLAYDENEPKDTFRNRIMFPIYDIYGQVVGYSGRIYNSENTAKYVNSKASDIFKKGELLYNYHLAKEETKKTKEIIIVEGFMDVIRLSIIGIDNVVGLMGTAITKEQILLLKQLRCKVILCLDSDEAGEVATMNAGDQLFENNIDTAVIRLEDYKDPDEYIINKGKEAFLLNLENSQNYIDYKIKYLKNKTPIDDSEKIAENINSLLNNISSVKDPILKNILIEKITKEFNISKDILGLKIINKKDAVESKEEKVIVKKKKSQVDKASEALIYLMLINSKHIKAFDKKLGYFPNNDYKYLLGEIRCYYNDNKDINIADFLSYINDDEFALNIIKDIIVEGNEIIDEKDFDNYLQIVSNEVFQIRINNLKLDLEKTSDLDKKIEITKKIAEIKKKITKL